MVRFEFEFQIPPPIAAEIININQLELYINLINHSCPIKIFSYIPKKFTGLCSVLLSIDIFVGTFILESMKKSINIKPSKQGSLRKALGVKSGKPIPAAKLRIKSTDSPALRKKKQFAINEKKFKH